MTTAPLTPATLTAAPLPDAADVIAAGRPYPLRDWRRPLDAAHLADLFEDRRVWWLDASIGYATLAEKARAHGDASGVDEAIYDARQALAAAAFYGRKVIGR